MFGYVIIDMYASLFCYIIGQYLQGLWHDAQRIKMYYVELNKS